MKRRALDLFCCGGGASRGLADAGFDVTGVDIEDQPSYPYTFVRGNVLELSPTYLRTFDLVWASPPCQSFTAYRRKDRATIGASALNLIPQTRALLAVAGVPSILENVEGARESLVDPITLCGSMFGLDVKRHRLFETSFEVKQPACDHSVWTPRFAPAGNRTNLRSTVEIGVYRIPLAVQQRAMGIDWMKKPTLSQAIPPAYAKYLADAYLSTVDNVNPGI